MITGAGSGVGQAIAKSLRLSDLDATIVMADIDPFNPGFFRGHETILIPRVEESGMLDEITSIIRVHRIDAVMIGSVFDMMFFAENKAAIETETGAMVVTSPPDVIEMATDKWLTAEFLRRHGLAHPRSHAVVDIDAAVEVARGWGFPVIVKPRRGRASHGVHVISDIDKLGHALALSEDPLLQEMISAPSAALSTEYTCSVVKLSDGRVLGPFTARRSLRAGHSWVVEVDVFNQLHPLLAAITDAVPFLGPFNIQLMIGPVGPVPFEFNPRFSGTSAMRAHFGFNEAEMILRADRLGERPKNPHIRAGMAFRYLEEVYIDGVHADGVSAPYPTGVVHEWF